MEPPHYPSPPFTASPPQPPASSAAYPHEPPSSNPPPPTTTCDAPYATQTGECKLHSWFGGGGGCLAQGSVGCFKDRQGPREVQAGPRMPNPWELLQPMCHFGLGYKLALPHVLLSFPRIRLLLPLLLLHLLAPPPPRAFCFKSPTHFSNLATETSYASIPFSVFVPFPLAFPHRALRHSTLCASPLALRSTTFTSQSCTCSTPRPPSRPARQTPQSRPPPRAPHSPLGLTCGRLLGCGGERLAAVGELTAKAGFRMSTRLFRRLGVVGVSWAGSGARARAAVEAPHCQEPSAVVSTWSAVAALNGLGFLAVW